MRRPCFAAFEVIELPAARCPMSCEERCVIKQAQRKVASGTIGSFRAIALRPGELVERANECTGGEREPNP
jgi:hypothetical protein